MPDPTLVEACGCGHPASHHRTNDDDSLAACLIDQCSCRRYQAPALEAFGGAEPPNRHVLPGDLAEAAGMPGPGQPADPTDADLADVLVNYDEIFQQIHGRYFQDHARMMQELAELRAGFNQAVARMRAAEAERDALKQILTDG